MLLLRLLLIFIFPLVRDRDLEVLRCRHSVAPFFLSFGNGARLLILYPHISSTRPLLLILRRLLRLLLFDVSHVGDDVETARRRCVYRK